MTTSPTQPSRAVSWLTWGLWSAATLALAAAVGTLVHGWRVAQALEPLTAEQWLARTGPVIDPNAVLLAERKIAESLVQKNFYVPPPPKRHPVQAVQAIVGAEALINGRWYQAGDRVGDARLVAVTPLDVTVEWEGRTTRLSPLGAPDAGGGPGGPSPATGGARPSGGSSAAVLRAPGGDLPVDAWRPTPEQIEQLKAMSPEQQKAFIQAHMPR